MSEPRVIPQQVQNTTWAKSSWVRK